MDPSTLGPVAIVQVIAVWLIQRLKEAKWFPWLTQNSATTSRIVAYLIALVTAAGITWQWNAAQGVLTISGLMWQAVVQGLWTALAGLVTNEMAYMLLQIKQQSASTGKEVGAPPIPVPPPVPVPDKPVS